MSLWEWVGDLVSNFVQFLTEKFGMMFPGVKKETSGIIMVNEIPKLVLEVQRLAAYLEPYQISMVELFRPIIDVTQRPKP